MIHGIWSGGYRLMKTLPNCCVLYDSCRIRAEENDVTIRLYYILIYNASFSDRDTTLQNGHMMIGWLHIYFSFFLFFAFSSGGG